MIVLMTHAPPFDVPPRNDLISFRCRTLHGGGERRRVYIGSHSQETQMSRRLELVANTADCSGVYLSGSPDRTVLLHVCDQEVMLS